MTPERKTELRALVQGLRNAAEMSHSNDQDEAADAITELLSTVESQSETIAAGVRVAMLSRGDRPPQADYIDLVFDGPPDNEMPRLIEAEDPFGKSIKAGEWIKREDGRWVLRIERPEKPAPRAAPDEVPE